MTEILIFMLFLRHDFIKDFSFVWEIFYDRDWKRTLKFSSLNFMFIVFWSTLTSKFYEPAFRSKLTLLSFPWVFQWRNEICWVARKFNEFRSFDLTQFVAEKCDVITLWLKNFARWVAASAFIVSKKFLMFFSETKYRKFFLYLLKSQHLTTCIKNWNWKFVYLLWQDIKHKIFHSIKSCWRWKILS